MPGYFVQALKEGYTDPKEEQEKKKVSQDQKEKRINDVIREVVEKDPEITLRAIEALKSSVTIQKRVATKEKQLGRILDVQDYRDDKILMTAVKAMIMKLQFG